MFGVTSNLFLLIGQNIGTDNDKEPTTAMTAQICFSSSHCDTGDST